jgi:hypothetical protein
MGAKVLVCIDSFWSGLQVQQMCELHLKVHIVVQLVIAPQSPSIVDFDAIEADVHGRTFFATICDITIEMKCISTKRSNAFDVSDIVCKVSVAAAGCRESLRSLLRGFTATLFKRIYLKIFFYSKICAKSEFLARLSNIDDRSIMPHFKLQADCQNQQPQNAMLKHTLWVADSHS